jgi:hypothetical protein
VRDSEVFDAANKRFSLIANLRQERTEHTATLLDDRTLLVASGDNEGSAEIFYPSAQKFEPIEGRLGTPRRHHSRS